MELLLQARLSVRAPLAGRGGEERCGRWLWSCFCLQVVSVVAFVASALAGHGGVRSSAWRWCEVDDGGPGRSGAGWKKGGTGVLALGLCAFIVSKLRRVRRTALAAIYKVWRRSLSGGSRYGSAGDGQALG